MRARRRPRRPEDDAPEPCPSRHRGRRSRAVTPSTYDRGLAVVPALRGDPRDLAAGERPGRPRAGRGRDARVRAQVAGVGRLGPGTRVLERRRRLLALGRDPQRRPVGGHALDLERVVRDHPEAVRGRGGRRDETVRDVEALTGPTVAYGPPLTLSWSRYSAAPGARERDGERRPARVQLRAGALEVDDRGGHRARAAASAGSRRAATACSRRPPRGCRRGRARATGSRRRRSRSPGGTAPAPGASFHQRRPGCAEHSGWPQTS